MIQDVDGDVMSLDYDSGKKDGENRRQCRYVFLKVGDVVVREWFYRPVPRNEELNFDDRRIIRPAYLNVFGERKYVGLEER